MAPKAIAGRVGVAYLPHSLASHVGLVYFGSVAWTSRESQPRACVSHSIVYSCDQRGHGETFAGFESP